jgi:integrase
MRLERFWDERMVGVLAGRRAATRAQDRVLFDRYIRPELGHRQLSSVDRLDIEEFVETLRGREVGAHTIAATYRVLRRILSAAEQSGIVGRNVARGVAVPQAETSEQHFLSPEDIHRIAGAIDPRYRALVLLMGFSGLRIGEAAALRVSDLDLLRRRVTITRAVSEVAGKVTFGPTKTGTSRAVGIPAFVAEAIGQHLAAHPAERDGLVFTAPGGGVLYRTTFRRRAFTPALAKAGLPHTFEGGKTCRWCQDAREAHTDAVRVHDLRHSAVAIAISAGAHPKQIQAMAGHASIQVTFNRYGHLFESLSEALADKLDAIGRRSAAFLLPLTENGAVVPLALS